MKRRVKAAGHGGRRSRAGGAAGTVPDAAAIGDIIPAVMKKAGLEGAHWAAVLEEDWAALVGAAVAAHTRPGRISGRTLVVFVDHSVWLNELARYGKREMLEKIRARVGRGKVTDLRFEIAGPPSGGG
ncbi:MAG: DUF721 domain-containing protein [Lentisphaerae bacterium]|nr:DUF721 domain-containing protein [Lentisphaerota bacterium]